VSAAVPPAAIIELTMLGTLLGRAATDDPRVPADHKKRQIVRQCRLGGNPLRGTASASPVVHELVNTSQENGASDVEGDGQPPSISQSFDQRSAASANPNAPSCFEVSAAIRESEIDQREAERDEADRVGVGIAETESGLSKVARNVFQVSVVVAVPGRRRSAHRRRRSRIAEGLQISTISSRCASHET